MKLLATRSMLLVLLTLPPAMPAAAQTVFPGDDWTVATPQSQAMSPEIVAKVGQWLKDNGSKTGLVVRHGRIVGEWYFDEATRDSKYLVYSTGKAFVSTAVGLAIAEGKLKLDSTVGEFFPDANPPEKREITVRQLLSMTSGAKDDRSILGREDLFDYVLHELPMAAPPGTKWEYNDSGLSLLSPVFHRAVGMNIDELLDERVFHKIGIPREDWRWDEREGISLVFTGLHITARSLARFGLLYLNKGMWEQKQVIGPDWVAAATSPSQELNPRYGYLWWNNRSGAWPGVPADAYAALALYDNDMLVVPSLDLIVIRQVGNDSGSNRHVNIAELFALACSAVED